MAGFPKKYVYTVGDPSNAGPVPDGVGVAIKVGGTDGATKEQIAAYKAAHPNNPILIWAASVEGQNYVDTLREAHAMAKQVGAAGFVAQSESQYELAGVKAVSNEITMPKVIVTTGDYGVMPPGWEVAFEYYANDPEKGLSPQNLAAFLKMALAQGATGVQVTIGSYGGMHVSMETYQQALDYLKSQGIDVSSVSFYIWGQSTPTQQEDFTGLTTGPAGADSSSTSSTSSTVTTKPKPKKPLEVKPPKRPAGIELGIGVEKPLKNVASPGYKGEDDPRLTYAYTDTSKKDNTLTFRPNGIVVQTKADGTSFVVWDPSKNNGQHWPGFEKQGIQDPYHGATFNEPVKATVAKTPNGQPSPAWHVNPGWKGLDDATREALKKINGIDASQVLEEREGANSQIVIFRMADGTYKSLDTATGKVADAGTWNKDQWNETGYGPKIKNGTVKANSTAQNKDDDPESSTSSTSSAAAESAKTPSGKPVPAWHVNKGWDDIDNAERAALAKVKGIDSSQVLESRPGQNGKTILRMADGSYKAVDAAGNVSGAGNWDNTQWNDTGYGTSVNPDGTVAGTSPNSSTSSTSSTTPSGPTNPVPAGNSTDTTAGLGGFSVAPAASRPGSCFPAGSLILTPDGHKPVEEIKLGDKVLSWSFDKKEMIHTKVTDVLSHHKRQTIIVNTDRGSVITTPEHPFWNGHKWLAAGELDDKSKIYHQLGELCPVTSVEEGPEDDVYNFHVASPAHNYFVDGFLVHNMKMLME